MLFSIKNTLYVVVILCNFLLSLFILIKGKNKKVNKVFFLSIMSANIWLVSLFLYYNVESPEYILWLGRINFATVLPILYYVFELSRIFPRNITPIPKKISLSIKALLVITTLLTIFTPLIDQEEIIIGIGKRETIYGPLYPLYVIIYFSFCFFTILLLSYKFRKFEKKIEKLRIQYVMFGLSLALISGFITNILLPFLGLFDSANYGVLSTLIFSIFVTIAIAKHRLFNTEVVLAQILVGVIGLILFIQAWLAETIWGRILDWSVFFLFSIFAYYLIKSTLLEVERRKELEKISKNLKKAYKELEVLDKAKSEFVSIASHQLRTPLTAIKGYLSLIQEKLYGTPPKKMGKPISNMYVSTERLINLVNDLLNMSRIESGKIRADLEILFLEDIIESVINELENLAKQKNIYIKWEKPEVPIAKVLADKDQIRQVILNLIDNAIRYTSTGGITIKTEPKNENYQIKIKDTGPGMVEEEISELFVSFRRGSVGRKTSTEGTGLGLYIAKKFVEMQNGKVWAESLGKGKGSTFYIEIPRSRSV